MMGSSESPCRTHRDVPQPCDTTGIRPAKTRSVPCGNARMRANPAIVRRRRLRHCTHVDALLRNIHLDTSSSFRCKDVRTCLGKTGTNSARRRALHKNVGIKPFPAYISSIRHFETREFLTKNRLIRHNWSGNSSGKAPPPQPGDVSWSGSSARSSSSQARPIRSG